MEHTVSLGASALQERVFSALRASTGLAREPDDFLERVLQGFKYEAKSLCQATDAIYRAVYYSSSQDLEIDAKEQRRLTELIRILVLDDDRVAALDYRTGLAQYKKRFREAAADGEITQSEQASLDAIAAFFGLKKRDINKAIVTQALAYYSFVLADATKDHVLTDDEIAELALIARRYGLSTKQVSTIPVPQKKEMLQAALAAIKAEGKIDEADYEHIRTLTHYLNAGDLLRPCLMDLDLYSRLFPIREGELPELDPDSLLLESGEKLHFKSAALFESRVGGKLQKRTGTLYIGTFKLRFIGRQSHEINCKNIFEVTFKTTRTPKLSLVVSSGKGSGDYRLRINNNAGTLLELREMLTFLGRKARRLIEPYGKSSSYIPSHIRSEVWYRDGGQCVICGAREYLELDHVIPRSKGGATTIDNLQVLCRKCNSQKSDRI